MPSARLGGLTPILLATVLAGVAGYLIQFVVPLAVSPEEYLRFSVFWAALYLVVSGLSGVQQEVSRATTRIPDSVSATSKTGRTFTIAAVTAISIAIPLSAFLWGPLVFPESTWRLVAALTVGCASYVVVAVLTGVFYGLSEWRVIGLQTVIDAALRLVLVVIGTSAGVSVDLLVWAVVLPFPLTVVAVWAIARRRVIGQYLIDVGIAGLSWNAARTVVGAAATGVLISGFPLLLALTSNHESAAAVGVLVLIVTLTRAPLVIPLLALQSFLTVYFRDRAEDTWRIVWMLLAGTALVTGLASAAASLAGPWLMETLYGSAYAVDAGVVALIVASAGLTAALCISGPAVLARGRHTAFLAGWVSAALVLAAVLLVPVDLVPRAVAALTIGPLCGLLVHLGSVATSARATRSAGRAGQPPR